MVPGLKHTCYKVAKASYVLYSGLAAASLVLTKAWPASFTGRVAVTVTSATGHADCAGSVTVGSEAKSFSASGQRLTYTTFLSALPAISTSGLDCNVLVEVITTSGQPYYEETLTAVKCFWSASQKSFKDTMGNFVMSDAVVLTQVAINATDTLRYDGINYMVKSVGGGVDDKAIPGHDLRKLYCVKSG